ncbi:CP2 transcription factor [Aspergillus sclerotialis]|uniref:CP2 transcription factor n=1 Tax=Aspergillus sclerotialis TaxID=2070753 RepID=A0A3A2ZXQ9_9EURO|nr:CP2 transcription factor [Aspergillus sclerotialis]
MKSDAHEMTQEIDNPPRAEGSLEDLAGGFNQRYNQAQQLDDPIARPYSTLEAQMDVDQASISHRLDMVHHNQLDNLFPAEGANMPPSMTVPHLAFEPSAGVGDPLIGDTSSYALGNFANQVSPRLERSHITSLLSGHTSLLRSVSDSDTRHTMATDIMPPSDVEDLAAPIPSQRGHSNMPRTSSRFDMTLQAQTAMIKDEHEIPVTYLNRGKVYVMSIADLIPLSVPFQKVKYRTCIRVAFDEKEQRSDTAASWGLWRRNQESSITYQQRKRPHALEYIDSTEETDLGDQKAQLESAWVDGFSVTYEVGPTSDRMGNSQYTIPLRLNLLSTDFSLSKGVKGIPLRLYAKTEVISPVNPEGYVRSYSEARFCKIKVFRDHGAERKLAHDVYHAHRSIEWLTHEISQLRLGSNSPRDPGPVGRRPMKISKPTRRRSRSVQASFSHRTALGNDLNAKLAGFRNMLTSTSPDTALSLPGEELDDPDLYPIQFSVDEQESGQTGTLTDEGVVASNAEMTALSGSSAMLSNDSGIPTESSQLLTGPQPIKSQAGPSTNIDLLLRQGSGEESLTADILSQSLRHIRVSDIDPSYKPTISVFPKPVACFYVRFENENSQQQDDIYQAVYLMERTASNFLDRLLRKAQIDAKRIVRMLTIKRNGIKVVVDDDVIRELPDGQDMAVRFSTVSPDGPMDLEVILMFG